MRVRQSSSRQVWSALFALLLIAASPAAAQESTAPRAVTFDVPVHLELRPIETPRSRPGALIPMYGSLIALQGLDIHSTRKGMSSGRTREANPLMGPVVNNGAAFVAVKAAATVGTIWAAEKLWKKNPKRAVIFAVLVNATMAAVVTHNYRVAK